MDYRAGVQRLGRLLHGGVSVQASYKHLLCKKCLLIRESANSESSASVPRRVASGERKYVLARVVFGDAARHPDREETDYDHRYGCEGRRSNSIVFLVHELAERSLTRRLAYKKQLKSLLPKLRDLNGCRTFPPARCVERSPSEETMSRQKL